MVETIVAISEIVSLLIFKELCLLRFQLTKSQLNLCVKSEPKHMYRKKWTYAFVTRSGRDRATDSC